MRSCFSDTRSQEIVACLALCNGCGRGDAAMWMETEQVFRHAGRKEFDRLRVLRFQKIKKPLLRNCPVSGLMMVGPNKIMVWRPVKLEGNPELSDLSSLIARHSESGIRLRKVAVPIIEAFQSKFSGMNTEAVTETVTETVAGGVKLSLVDMSRALGGLEDIPVPQPSFFRPLPIASMLCGCVIPGNGNDVPYTKCRDDYDPAVDGLITENPSDPAVDSTSRNAFEWTGYGRLLKTDELAEQMGINSLKHEYTAYAVGLVLLGLYSNLSNCKDGNSFRKTVCNFLAKLETKIWNRSRVGFLNLPDENLFRGEAINKSKIDIYLDDLKYRLQNDGVIDRYFDSDPRHFEAELAILQQEDITGHPKPRGNQPKRSIRF
ncbi:hypothetical protein GNI_091970 [Gregarina niphandrodes]|uniref:Uncharacterized protein n=1 Tax=Gregarina niphandrodes TaxID=110365 RepID=A0A023B5B2_GRENI|nr:hypothetical protein GNI_091970 [Gregarina niphandrodes]EZG59686.1 hypothetical protein GNI_091970 [Gregarina niphandrodes]|eukprot:XP_011130885.1 hypothetical protein GNI_091970 [Gregarina niphandrodes]